MGPDDERILSKMIGTENWGLVALGGLAAFISNVLYMWGGTEMSWGGKKWLRRFLGSFVLAAAANGIALVLGNWAWQYILIWPALIGGMSLGYGADNLGEKILKRSIFALGVCTAGIFGLWATGWTGFGIGILVMQVVIGAASVFLGAQNPYSNSPLEQFLISQILTLTVPFWAFVR